jgi:hypothetical protein
MRQMAQRPVRVEVTANRSTFLSFYPDQGDSGVLRLHQCFLEAPAPVLEALARYVGKPGRGDLLLIRQFAESRMEASAPHAPPRQRLRSRGQVHDLHQLLVAVRSEYFAADGLEGVRITYGRGPRTTGGPRRSIHYGTYNYQTSTITIHPALDSPEVPEYFVRFVIFHELIHAVLPRPETLNGRRRIHDEEFRVRERIHPDFEASTRFSREFLRQLR